jgi:hypothetical protein
VRIPNIVGASVATACLSLVGFGVLIQSADGAAKPQEQDQTYQMFANVDAEGDLGSNHDAVKVSLEAGDHIYTIRFAHYIDTCAATVQAGRAGGTDPVIAASSVVAQSSRTAFVTRFTDPDGNRVNEPFMITVTCNR